MAERRMFAKTIIDSDAFLDMPLSTQALYFHLSMRADDDGFLNNAQKIMRMVGAARNDFDLLLAKRFVIEFPDGICVIKHWRIHNYIQKDRYKPTVYKEERAALIVKDNGAYTLEKPTVVYELDAECIQDVSDLETQDRLGEDRLGQESTGEENTDKPAPKHKHGKYGHVRITDAEYEKLIADLGEIETDRVIEYVDEYAEESGKRYKNWNLTLRRASRGGWGRQKGTEAPHERDYSGDGFRKGN